MSIRILRQTALKRAKSARARELAALKVEHNGAVYDGDETSQSRIARAIAALAAKDKIEWRAADNNFVELAKSDLVAILAKCVVAQTALWQKYADIEAQNGDHAE
jgi:hypothetical protein